MRTRLCTEVLLHAPALYVYPQFGLRRVLDKTVILQKQFKSEQRFAPQHVLNSLRELADHLEERKQDERRQLRKRCSIAYDEDSSDEESFSIGNREILSRAQKINKKRQSILFNLQAYPDVSVRRLQRLTGCSYEMIRSVMRQIKLYGRPTEYRYNHTKSPEQIQALRQSFVDIHRGYTTVAELKRKHPDFSRKFILQELKATGHKWKRLPRQREKPEHDPPRPKHVFKVISHLAQALHDPTAEVYYCDEMKFPLRQNASYHWINPAFKDELVYSRRYSETITLNAVVMCSTRGFHAVQIYKQEINADEFIYFLTKAIPALPELGKSYTILTDNATWHTAEAVRNTEASKLLFFNVPYAFQINLIENAFSAVRDAFRRRPQVQTMEEEAKLIFEIFFDPKQKQRFKGILRNHVRTMVNYLEDNMKEIEKQDDHEAELVRVIKKS